MTKLRDEDRQRCEIWSRALSNGAISIDEFGRVWRHKKSMGGAKKKVVAIKKSRAEYRTANGYLQLHLYEEGRRYVFSAHRVVWEYNFGEIPSGVIVHHKNEDRSDNRLSNLGLMSFSKNNRHHKRTPWNKGLTKANEKLREWHNRTVKSRWYKGEVVLNG